MQFPACSNRRTDACVQAAVPPVHVLPGDHIAYYDKILYVNGKAVTDADSAEVQPAQSGPDRVLLGESQNGHSYRIQWMRGIPSREGEREVPPGHYFVWTSCNGRCAKLWRGFSTFKTCTPRPLRWRFGARPRPTSHRTRDLLSAALWPRLCGASALRALNSGHHTF